MNQLDTLAETARRLADIAHDDPRGQLADRLARRLAERRFLIAVIGEFKRGKSTLINALLGDLAVPTGALPLTAVAIELSDGEQGARVENLDGRCRPINPGDPSTWVIEVGNPRNHRQVARVHLTGRWPLLRPGAVIVDTPGVGSIHAHSTATAEAALLDTDGAIVVLAADAPLSQQEHDMLALLARRRAPTFYVLNKIDHLAEGELNEVVRFVHDALRTALPADPEIFAISAQRTPLSGRRCRRRRLGPLHRTPR